MLDERPGFGLELVAAETLELQLEIQLGGLVLERRLGILDALLDGLDGLILFPELLQLPPRRIAGFILSVMLWVRSGLMTSQVMPSSRVRKTTLPAM